MSTNKGAEVQMLTKKISELEEVVVNLKQDIRDKNSMISNLKVLHIQLNYIDSYH